MRSAGDESIVQSEGPIKTPSIFHVSPRLAEFVEHNCFAMRWSDLSNISQRSIAEEELVETYSEVVEDLKKLKGVHSFDSRTTNEFSVLRYDNSILFESPRTKPKPYLHVLQALKKA
mmetsp:Transcript_13442/g.25335  ORF Transcript_13442/g.25335 Transcript_13442/m.25335 type:complete len:117 (+) Transcript_13442:1061-1411(+)